MIYEEGYYIVRIRDLYERDGYSLVIEECKIESFRNKSTNYWFFMGTELDDTVPSGEVLLGPLDLYEIISKMKEN